MVVLFSKAAAYEEQMGDELRRRLDQADVV